MSHTQVVFYCDGNGRSSVFEWLKDLRANDPRAWAKCRARIDQLATFGHELRRPASDFLRDGIRELRVRSGNVQYRILYFFGGKQLVVLAHALRKEDSAVPFIDIERAIERKDLFCSDPSKHTFELED